MISRFKTLSKLSQGLGAVEAQLQELYALAVELANPASDVIVLTSLTKRNAATNAAAVDVISKPDKLPKPVKVAKKSKKRGLKVGALTSNDSKLMGYLQVALKTGDAKAITGSVMAAGSGLPIGSVGVSLKKIIATGAVNQVGRGTYQLGFSAANVTAPAQEPVVKSAAGKKAKPEAAKKVKSLKTVKAKRVKAAKAAPAKKPKTSFAKKAKSASRTVTTTVDVTAPAVESEAAPL